MHGLYEAEKQNMQDIRASSLKSLHGVIENVKNIYSNKTKEFTYSLYQQIVKGKYMAIIKSR